MKVTYVQGLYLCKRCDNLIAGFALAQRRRIKKFHSASLCTPEGAPRCAVGNGSPTTWFHDFRRFGPISPVPLCLLLFVFGTDRQSESHKELPPIMRYWHGALKTAEVWPACSQILSDPYLLQVTKRYWLLILSCLLSILHSTIFSVFTHPGRDDVLCDLVNRYVLELKPTFITHALYY